MYKQNNLFIKTLVIMIVVLFLGIAIFPCFNVVSKEFDLLDIVEVQDETTVTCYVFDKTGSSESEVVLSSDDFDEFYFKFEELNDMITCYPFSGETQVLKVEFVDFLNNLGLIPEDTSRNDIIRLINPPIKRPRSLFSLLPQGVSNGRGSAFFCNFATWGEGTQFPVIILPRLIPILLTPIPRVIMRWNAYDGVTSCGGLLTGKGFIAEGAQQGTALGFWGIGFSVFLPPVMSFGFIGYALFATATAEVIHPWPPNREPVISEENPLDGSVDVSLSLSELSFRINDADGDHMNYTVTTNPDIGLGDGQNIRDGVYKVPVSELKSNTEYCWRVVVDDGEDTSEEFFSFHTEIVAPIVSDPLPDNGDSWVSVDLSEMSFKLKDFQGDLMDYTVETVPNIGSDSANGVGDGVYTVDVSGLDYTTDYTWFVNVTDGEYWTREIFIFKTQPIMVFDPFDEGWMYRKKITIDHDMVDGDLVDFPVLVSVVDPDLRDKAQSDGDDILFMDGSDVANRLLHEIELYDDSNGNLVAWMKIPELDGDVDTVLYMYYGNPKCGNQQYPKKVWDSDYVGVWHILESGKVTRYDSTQNNNDGTPIGYEGDEATSSGKIDGADWLDGGNDYLNFGDINDMDGVSQLSISAWFKADDISDIGTDYRAIVGKNNGDSSRTAIHIRYTKELYFLVGNGINSYAYTSAGTISTGSWYHVVLVFNGLASQNVRLKGYLNGLPLSFDHYSGNFPVTTAANSAFLGIGYDNQKDHFEGTIDEIRISNATRSAAWISTEYNNQNDPLDFLSFGPEESSS